MKVNHFIFRATVLLILFYVARIPAQCVSCSTVINANSGANITINSGAVLCINAGVTYSGNITVSGGTLCNQGTITKITLNNGTFNNYGIFNQSTAININSTGDVKINCFPSSIFSTDGAFNHSPGSSTTNLFVNLYQGSRLIVSGGFSSNKGNINIVNGLSDPNGSGGGGTTGTGPPAFFNINGQFNVSNSGMNFTNLRGSYVNINGVLSLDAKYNKTIFNVGTFNLNNSFNVGGNGQNTGTVTINNYEVFNITNHLNLSYNNGVASVNNNGILSVGKSITISKENNSLLNNNSIGITNDLNVERGSAVNNGIMSIRDVDVKFGAFTNNNNVSSRRDIVISNTTGVINNNGYIRIVRELNNKGTINLGQTSIIETNDFLNYSLGANITSTLSIPDTLQFPKIIITDASENSAIVSGRMIIYDLSLISEANTIGFGFDQIGNGSNISNTVYFLAKSVAPGNGNPAVQAPCIIKTKYLFSVGLTNTQIGSTTGTVQSMMLHAQLQYNISNTYTTIIVSVNSPNITYTWQPSINFINPNLQDQIVYQTITTNYSVLITYLGCTYQSTLGVVVPMTVTIAKTHTDYQNGANGTATVTVSGGLPPYRILWEDNFIGSVRQELQSAQYLVRVTDSLRVDTVSLSFVIGTKPYWLKVINAIAYEDSITVVNHDSLGVLVADNLIESGKTGWFELRTTQLNQDFVFGFIGANENLNFKDSLYSDSVYSNRINLAYNLFQSAISNTLPYTSTGVLNLPTSYSNINLIRINNGVIKILFNGSSISNTYTYSTGDLLLVGRNSNGNLYVSKNGAVLFSQNINSFNLFNNPIVIANENLPMAAPAIIVGPGNPVDPFLGPLPQNKIYAVLKPKIDGGYYSTIGNTFFYFKIEGEYNNTILKYNIYNFANNVVQSNLNVGLVNNSNQLLGDNRYTLNVINLYTGLYVLEVINEKNEKTYLRFTHQGITNNGGGNNGGGGQ